MNGLNIAIIAQAVDDYKKIVAGLQEETCNCNLREIESFFKSDWCENLLQNTNYNPTDLLNLVHAYKEQWEREHPETEDFDEIKQRAIMGKCIAIRCVETGQLYYGVRAAARGTYSNAYQISRSIHDENFTAGGYHFRIVYDPYADNDWNRRTRKTEANENKGKRGSYKKVRCIDTGVVYVNCSDAGKKLHIPARKISRCARGAAKHAGGLRWEYTDENVIPQMRDG